MDAAGQRTLGETTERLFREHEEIEATRPVQMIVEYWSLNISRFHRITVMIIECL